MATRARRWLRAIAIAGALLIGVPGVLVGVAFATIELPERPALSQQSVVYYADGSTAIARLGDEARTSVSLAQVPEPVRHAVLAAEDRNFYDHAGISPSGAARAARGRLPGGENAGSGTITQQLTRMTVLSPERSVSSQVREAVLAVKTERRESKDAILAAYLNTVYFGWGTYGVDAAARAYFGVAAEKLTVEQGAVLAALIRSPRRFDPVAEPDAAQARWRYVLDAMAEQGWLDRDQARAARYPQVNKDHARWIWQRGANGTLAGQIRRELTGLGISDEELRSAGLRVITTVDAASQRAAADAAREGLLGKPVELRTAVVAVRPETGQIIAYYGGEAGLGMLDLAALPHPAGGTLQPYARAAALQAGTASVGAAQALALARRAGVDTAQHNTGTATLDGYQVSALALAGGYATLAGTGTSPRVHLVQRVLRPDGTVRYAAPTGRAGPALKPEVTKRLAADLGPTDLGGGRRAVLVSGAAPVGQAGAHSDLWTAGYTPRLAVAVWVGHGADAQPLRGAAGLPASIWRAFLARAEPR